MNRRVYIWGSVLLVALLIWAGNRAWQAHQNLVTLDVHDADVRDVVRKIEWQTWETIVVNKDVKGKVTLNVHKVPLEEVMGIIGEQTSSRFSAIYPIFSKNNSVVKLRKLLRGDLDHETAGWTNYSTRGFGGFGGGRGGPGGGFGGGDTTRNQNSLVSLTLSGKDLSFAALALARFSQAQVVPEDGASGIISLQLAQVPFTEAVAKVAKQAQRKWEVLYALQDRPDFGGRGGDNEGRRGFGRGDGEGETNRQARFEARQEERTAERERETEARLATMTPEEQAKAKEQQQKFEEMRNMPPEQRQAAFEAMRNDPANQQRGENRRANYLNNSTPEQRSDRTRQMMERRARRDAGQQQPPRGR